MSLQRSSVFAKDKTAYVFRAFLAFGLAWYARSVESWKRCLCKRKETSLSGLSFNWSAFNRLSDSSFCWSTLWYLIFSSSCWWQVAWFYSLLSMGLFFISRFVFRTQLRRAISSKKFSQSFLPETLDYSLKKVDLLRILYLGDIVPEHESSSSASQDSLPPIG